jgi:hypothetical protein
LSDLLAKRCDRLFEHPAVHSRPRKAKLGFGARERELERSDARLTVTFLRAQLPPDSPGSLGFALLKLDVLALETSRHPLSSLC